MMALMSLQTALLMFPGLVIGLTLHEFAHAWSASLLGDNFPRRQGRVSLNPLRHLAPLGTLAIFLLPFGWGRPVIVNLHNFRRPKRDYLISSLAGPLANLVVVAACIGLMQLTRHTYALGPGWAPFIDMAHRLTWAVAIINVLLAVLNLIPIPPLDGSKIWPCLIPGLKPGMKVRTTWVFVVILVVLLYTNALGPAIGFVMEKVNGILPAPDDTRYITQSWLGWKEIEANQFPEAERSFTRALEINPNSPDGHWGRAIARAEQGHWQGALEDGNRAAGVGLGLVNAKCCEIRAKILDALGRSADANADRERAAVLRGLSGTSTQPASDPALWPAPG
jgi:Zn-dependent protease